MSATYRLFERWKMAKGHPSSNAAALALGERRQTVQHWKDGKNGSADVIERMCADLKEDPVPVILESFAESQRSSDARRTLERLSKRVRGGALVLIALALPLLSMPAEARVGASQAIHYAHWLMRRAQQLLQGLQSKCRPQQRSSTWKRSSHALSLAMA